MTDLPKENPKKTRRGILSTVNVEQLDDVTTSASKIYTSRVNTFEKLKYSLHGYDLLQTFSDNTSTDNPSPDPDEVIELSDTKGDEVLAPEDVFISPKNDEKSSQTLRKRSSDEGLSPSPPLSPVVTSKKPCKPSRKTTSLLNSLRALQQAYHVSNILNPNPLTSEVDDDIINKDDDVHVIDDEPDKDITLKIRWNGQVYRIPTQMGKRLYTIYPELSKICACSPSEILLTRHETTLTPDATPISLKINAFEILDCYTLTPQKESEEADSFRKENMIQLKVQSKNSKQRIIIEVNKMDPLSVLMEKYSSVSGLPLAGLNFYFDGELLSPSDTPMDMDLEDDCCIDVTVKK